VRPWVTMITRLRRDAALHKPPPRRLPGKAGRPPVVGPPWSANACPP
jgi:hypothetical protein